MILGKVSSELEEVAEGALAGMALLHGSRLEMEIVENGPVRISPIERDSGY